MTELHLKAGLYVFAVAASLWLGGGLLAQLIVLAFICVFAGSGARLPDVISTMAKILKWPRDEKH
jgi:hypothetical protein